MGFWSRFVRNEPLTPAQNFDAISAEDIPASFFGLSSYSAPVAPAPRIDRRSAVQVPAVKRAQDLVPGTLGRLPIDLIGPDQNKVTRTLFSQPEKNRPRSVTMAETYADLFYEGHAWWLVVEREWNDWPRHVRRLDPRTVTVTTNGVTYTTKAGNSGMAMEWASDADIIHFESPNEPLLIAGARAIRTCLLLDDAARRHAEGAPPLDYFTSADGIDPDDLAFLDDWKTARQTRSTGYIPAGLNYNTAGWNPEQMQMAEARQHAVLEISRAAGVDAEDLGVSTTSRTYQNAFDRKQARIQDTLSAYMVAVEERLSMGDVTPRGYVAKTNLFELLRSDDLTRFAAYKAGLEVGVYVDTDEVRQAEGLPVTDKPAAPLRALPTQEESAS